MLYKLAHGRIFGLVIGLAAAASATAVAQDTTAQGAQDQNDTSQVQNPPGYSGMERDTTLVPPSATDDKTSPGHAEDRATGTYDDSAWQDTSEARQNPAGYRGMGRLKGDTTGGQDSAAGDTSASDTSASGAAADDTTGSDTTSGDTTAVGQTAPRKSDKPEARPPTAAGDTTGQSSGTGQDSIAE